MASRLWTVPLRLATGAYILNSGLGKRTPNEARAARLKAQAELAFPKFGDVEPLAFLRLLSTGEIALGAALLAPFVPSWLAGAGLGAFSGSLLRMYWKNPEMHPPGDIRPSPPGIAVSKDVWMLAIALALMFGARRRTNESD
jgi:uncharacterized membrane protein YphA (DoxX/SURF4 family)